LFTRLAAKAGVAEPLHKKALSRLCMRSGVVCANHAQSGDNLHNPCGGPRAIGHAAARFALHSADVSRLPPYVQVARTLVPLELRTASGRRLGGSEIGAAERIGVTASLGVVWGPPDGLPDDACLCPSGAAGSPAMRGGAFPGAGDGGCLSIRYRWSSPVLAKPDRTGPPVGRLPGTSKG
jgi:hypothetical protein